MNEKEIITRIYCQWRVAKEQRRRRCEAAGLFDMAKKLAACDLFKGEETPEEAARLFLSPEGTEFCLAANFPSLATFRLLKQCDLARYGVYIDAGVITLENPETAVLVGRTLATIRCDTCRMHTVVTMHGASANVIATGWAVVRTETGVSTNITRRAAENAIIL